MAQVSRQELSQGQLENGMWIADDKILLVRLLCLGSRSQTYHTIDWTGDMINIMCVSRLVLSNEGLYVLDTIKSMSRGRRVAKMDVLISVYAYLATQNEDISVKKKTLDAFLEICKTPGQLFLFLHYSFKFDHQRSWDITQAVARWYNQFDFEADPHRLAMYVTMYPELHNWSHGKVLSFFNVRANPDNRELAIILNYAKHGLADTTAKFSQHRRNRALFAYLKAVEYVKNATMNTPDIPNYITCHNLQIEHIPKPLLNRPDILKALLQNMPLQAIVTNLQALANLGLLTSGSDESRIVCEKLQHVTFGLIHPFDILVARREYGHMGDISIDEIKNALELAFTNAFNNVKPTGLRFCVAVDINASMSERIHDCPYLTAREAAAAMVITVINTEIICDVLALGADVQEFSIPQDTPLDSVLQMFAEQNIGQSDFSRPLKWALTKKKFYDVFIVYTSCYPSMNTYPASQALADYQAITDNPNVKFIACAMSTRDYTVVDPKDPKMLNIVGFDSNVPDIIHNFLTYI